MDTSQAFESKFLHSDDIRGTSPVVTIERVEFDKVGGDKKLIVYFKGKKKGLALNKTNWSAICQVTGSKDSEVWTGTEIQLRVEQTEFDGKPVDGIRVNPHYTPSRQINREPGDDQQDNTPF